MMKLLIGAMVAVTIAGLVAVTAPAAANAQAPLVATFSTTCGAKISDQGATAPIPGTVFAIGKRVVLICQGAVPNIGRVLTYSGAPGGTVTIFPTPCGPLSTGNFRGVTAYSQAFLTATAECP